MRRFISRAIRPLKIFIADSRAVGILLICCTIISLLITNLMGGWYENFWNYNFHFFSSLHLPHSVLKWINDFLMAFFFLLAGMEIKKELVTGELSSFKKAVLPFGAALGGMLVPAIIFLTFNVQSGFAHGWGIPTATDIAFSLGVASLFSKRVPPSLKIFLMALAIIDDLGAIVVIALFYGGQIKWLYLLIAALIYGIIWSSLHLKKMSPGILHICLSLLLWFVILNSGIEASITGVLIAFAMPVNSLSKIENAIHKEVNFIILPLFALANTAILIPADIAGSLQSSISIGVIAGLVLGKPIGIFLVSKILVGLKIAHLPNLTNWKQFLGMGALAGIGFTMSIFTTTLAFQDEINRNTAKIAIIASLVLSVTISWIYFMAIEPKTLVRKQIKFNTALVPELG